MRKGWRRNIGVPDDVLDGNIDAPSDEAAERFRSLYDRALPEVYGYLLYRCGDVSLAEDLTSEVFLAAARSVRQGEMGDPTVAWLIAVARNKLIDHWRRKAREERGLN